MTKIIQDPDPGLDITTVYEYDSADNLLTVTDPNGNKTAYIYDDVNRRVTWIQDPTGLALTKTYDYDANGNVLTQTDAEGVKTVYEYCSKDLVTKQIVDHGVGNLNLTTTYDVCAMKRITKMTDPKGKVTYYQYDGLYRRTKVTDDYDEYASNLNISTSYFFDKVGNLTRITDDNSNSTDYEFDKLNRLTKETFADTETVTFEYDSAGNLITKTDQLGNEFVHSYDSMNRLTKKDITRAGGVNGTTAQAFYFDAIGRMTKATDDNGSNDDSEVSWYYDDASRVTRESQTVGVKTTRNVDSLYDEGGNRTKITYPSASYLELSYDNVNNMTRIYDGSTAHASYEYSDVNLVTKKTLGTSTAVDLEVYYDNGYRITKYDWVQSSSTLVGFTYGYDDAGNKNYQEVLHGSGLDELYEYDTAHRITNFKKGDLTVAKDDITSPARTQTYELDGLGNWTRVTTDSNSEDRTVNNMNEYTQIGTTSNTHDDNGNLTDDNTLQYEYDALNRLIKVVKKSGSSTIAEIAYDALNRRIFREADEDKNGSTEIDKIYVWDGYRNIAEYDYGDDAFIQEYYFGPMYLDEAVATYDGSNTYYYTTNHLFTAAALLNSSGNVVEWYDYDPYGKVTIYTGSGNDSTWFTSDDTTASIPAQGSYITFTGKPWDPESETTYHINRYMSHSVGASGYAERGRWLTRDSLWSFDGMNFYSGYFVPRGMDPLGLVSSENSDKKDGFKCCKGETYNPDLQCCVNEKVEDRYEVCLYALLRKYSQYTKWGHAWVSAESLFDNTKVSFGSYIDTDGPVAGDEKQHFYDKGLLPWAAKACCEVCGPLPKVDWNRGYNSITNNCIHFAVDYYRRATDVDYGKVSTVRGLWTKIMGFDPYGKPIHKRKKKWVSRPCNLEAIP